MAEATPPETPPDASADAADETLAAARRRPWLRRWMNRLLWVAGLVGWCAAGWLYLTVPDKRPSYSTSPPPAYLPQTPFPAGDGAHPSGSATADGAHELVGQAEPLTLSRVIQRVDAALEEQNPELAISWLNRLESSTDDTHSSEVLFRRGLAHEALGDMAAAEPAFRGLLDGNHTEHFRRLAKLGLARIGLYEDRPELALALASELLLAHGQEGLGAQLHADVLHVIAQAHFARAMPRKKVNYLDDAHCAYLWPRLSTGYLLGVLRTETVSSPHEPPDEVTVKYKHGTTPDGVLLLAHQSPRAVHELVKQWTHAAEIPVQWSERAAALALRHTASIHTSGSNLAGLLDKLLDPLDIVWFCDGQSLMLQLDAETSPDKLTLIREESASRALRDAISAAPEHPLASYGYLALGNLAYHRQEHSEASGIYQTLLDQYRHADCVAEAWHNLGKCHLSLGEREEACNAFFHAADHAVGRLLEGVGYLYAGRVLLEDNRAEEAIRPLARAVPRAATVDVRGAAAVTLAVAYLHNDNPRTANAVLVEEREYLERSRFREVAVLVDAIARFDVAQEGPQRTQHGRAMVAALAQVDPSQFFGHHAPLVLGQACERVGLLDQMARTYQGALEQPLPLEVERQLRFQLSDYFVAMGNREQALKCLETLAESENEPLVRATRLKIANLLLLNEQYDRCRENCRWLLAHPGDDVQRRETLRILGHVYQARRDFENAARCFEGLVPPVDADVVPKDTVPTSAEGTL